MWRKRIFFRNTWRPHTRHSAVRLISSVSCLNLLSAQYVCALLLVYCYYWSLLLSNVLARARSMWLGVCSTENTNVFHMRSISNMIVVRWTTFSYTVIHHVKVVTIFQRSKIACIVRFSVFECKSTFNMHFSVVFHRITRSCWFVYLLVRRLRLSLFVFAHIKSFTERECPKYF